jgi:anaerobic magnesium-protoporphyrin IX monomethyl ester cyclase
MTMHVVLVGTEREENLSLRYLASALRQAGHSVSLARFDSPEHQAGVVQQTRLEHPGMVGLSLVFQARGREFFDLARALRRAGYEGHITAGGHFATFAYEPILRDLPELDSIVRQEGEQTIVELAEALQCGGDTDDIARIPGMVVRAPEGGPIVAAPRQKVDDLDTLPFPVRDTPPELHLGVPTGYLVGSRGCYAACDYCCISAWHKAAPGKRYRVRTVESIGAEMALLYHGRGVRNFVFHDDNFFLPTVAQSRERCAALRAEVQRRKLDGIGFVVKLRPDDCDRENLLILRDIGLLQAFIGIDNTSQRQLRSLGRQATVADLEASLDLLGELGMYCAYNLLLFDAYTTLEDVAANLRFLRRNLAHPFNWCRVEVYAGTELEKRYESEGRLHGDYLGRGYDMDDPRAQLMFDLLLPAIYDRNFDPRGLSNLNTGLGYHRQLLKHFYPGRCSAGLSGRVQGAIMAVNRNSLDLLEQAYEFAQDVDLEQRSAIDRFAAQFRRGSLSEQQTLTRRVEGMLGEIEGRAGDRFEAPIQAQLEEGGALSRRGLLVALGMGFLGLLTGCADPAPPPMDRKTPEDTEPAAKPRPKGTGKG